MTDEGRKPHIVERRKRCAFDENIECPSVLGCCANGCTEHPEKLDPEKDIEP